MKRLFTLVPSLFIATPALAAINASLEKPQGWIDLLNKWLGYFTDVFWIVAIAMIFWAAYQYVTAGDDPDQVSSANKTFLFAAVGIGVALLATVIPSLVKNILS